MAQVSGACLISKITGMLYIKEEETPAVLEWNAMDQLKSLKIPLNCLRRLQAPKESSPKMMLRILYQKAGDAEEKDVKLSFTNRPTMNNIKESLQTIIARLKTIIKDSPTPQSEPANGGGATPTSSSAVNSPTPSAPVNLLDFSNPDSLSDSSLLKNHQLQQKLLLEDRNLRNIFTQSVINFKLLPNVFWSTRLNQLRTYALTISQHRGPYNVLSTIKPVATSDNQVNVNVTRDKINEIFDTYPIVKRAFNELVPTKLSEGEFWSRFFNSKLFRRLRGEKINTINTRGDVVIDKFLYIDVDFVDREEEAKKAVINEAESQEDKPIQSAQNHPHVSKIIDLLGNEEDNSQRLGNKPDVTMRFYDQNKEYGNDTKSSKVSGQENEMIILMQNMNKLSTKIVNMNSILKESNDPKLNKKPRSDDLSAEEINEYETELNLHDLNESEELKYIKLQLNTNISYDKTIDDVSTSNGSTQAIGPNDLAKFFSDNQFTPEVKGTDLTQTYSSNPSEIDKAAIEVTNITKINFRTYRSANNYNSSSASNNVISDAVYQELITFNITIMEFLSHFWKIFLNGNNPVQLKKIFASLKNCKSSLNELVKNIEEIFNKHEIIGSNERLKEKLVKDLQSCVFPLQSGLDKAINEYVKAVRALTNNDEVNENGKRPLQS